MKELPILFSAPMVRALLDGSKTQTRRPVKPQPLIRPGMDCTRLVFLDRKGAPSWDVASTDPLIIPSLCPYGVPGDRLWVREAHALMEGQSYADGKSDTGALYRATVDAETDAHVRWRPSIHMPRWASRITLVVVAVRVERLQSVSEADAVAEGVKANPFPGPWWQGYRRMDDGSLMHQQTIGETPPDWMVEPHPMRATNHLDRSAVDGYRTLWEQINGAGAWDANPWVWVVEFRRVGEV